MGAGNRVVAVGSYDHFPAEVERLPKVGALLDPDVERILTLKPDLVIVYETQTDLKTQLDRAKIPYYPAERFAAVHRHHVGVPIAPGQLSACPAKPARS